MESPRVWTVADAKARLSEVLRRASEEGPQRIGTKRRYVVVPEELWDQRGELRAPLGAWLVDHLPQGETLQLPDRQDPPREIPFSDADENRRR